jgi:malonyl-CoA O-methyltransferase
VAATPERVLDIGTGTGEGALFLAREFPRASIRGVDLSEEMIRAAQGKVGLDPDGRIAFKVADASRLPYDAEAFDLVAQLNMPPFFAEIARVLRPGGAAVVAASWGDTTPFYTPPAVLERGFRRAGMSGFEQGVAGAGTWFLARKSPE